jgi:hypothetical protein
MDWLNGRCAAPIDGQCFSGGKLVAHQPEETLLLVQGEGEVETQDVCRDAVRLVQQVNNSLRNIFEWA